MIRKPKKERTKNISRLILFASSMKIKIKVSHAARAITAICSFLIRIPVEETLLSFINICSFFIKLAILIKNQHQKHNKGIKIIKISEFIRKKEKWKPDRHSGFSEV
jgi:hypothetical protein